MLEQPTHKIETANGHQLVVSHRDGTGLPVLFINSVAADHTMWGDVRDRMTRTSIAYDARGHGGSDVTPGTISVEELAQDAIAVMDAEGIERAMLCGLSLGGLTAMQVAAETPDRVAGLALANTATNFTPASLWKDRAAAARGGGWPDLIQPTLERWVTEMWRKAHPKGTTQIIEMLKAMPPEGYAAACAALETGDTAEALAKWSGPTLIIAGAHDQSCPVERAYQMKTLSPQADLVILETAHVAAIEDPFGFTSALEAFAARIEAGHV
jgi:3-oxoadipate enol-lactonase